MSTGSMEAAGRLLHEARMRRDITATELAKRIESSSNGQWSFDYNTIRRIENGERSTSTELLVAIARLVGADEFDVVAAAGRIHPAVEYVLAQSPDTQRIIANQPK